MCDVFGEVCFNKTKMFTNGLNCLKKGQNDVQDEERPNRSTIASTSEMLDSVNVLILAERRVTTEDISENWEFLWAQHTKLYMITLPFLRLVVVGFPKY